MAPNLYKGVFSMTKYVLAAVAMMMGLSTVACGGDDCDQTDRIKAKVEQCGGTWKEVSSSESSDSDAECTDELKKQAEDAAKAFEELPCEQVLVIYPKA